jgi:hypothetical protein
MLGNTVTKIEVLFVEKYGNRGVCLWLIGIPWTLLGVVFILTPMERFSKAGPSGPLQFLDDPPGSYAFASLWLIGGLTAIAAALIRPRTRNDEWGFVGATVPPFLWGAGYFWSQTSYLVSDGESGKSAAYLFLIVYWSFSLLLLFLSKRLSDTPEGRHE